MKRWQTLVTSLVLLVALLLAPQLYGEGQFVQAGPRGPQNTLQDSGVTLVRVYYPDRDVANKIFISFEAAIIETNYAEGYHLLAVTPQEMARLTAAGLRVVVDENQEPPAVESIPSYPCYRTVEETFATAQAIVNDHPTLAAWTDVGDSWEKTASIGGYDLMVLKLTNSAIAGPKPKLFITGAIHAREYTTAEMATRFAEYLIDNYGSDADATWIIDYTEVHLMLQTNPDGRKQAEAGYSWRKNTNQNYCGPTSTSRGADLNRNFSYQWACCGGSSDYECDTLYHGPYAASEPETQVVQNYMLAQFPDQRGDGETTPAPDDATGVYIDLHSYSELVIWPWGYTSTPPGNATQLQTLGRKFAYWNNYTPQQAIGLYPTDGTTDDYLYGELGVASYCFELGTTFFQSCSYFESTIVPEIMPALIYAAKVSRTPYMTPAGPDAYNLALSNDWVAPGAQVTLSATVDDTRYYNGNGAEPTQNVAAAEYYVDTPPWGTGATAIAMTASDGNFNAAVEDVQATVDTAGWSEGQHSLFVRGKDTNNNWGAVSAVFITISNDPAPTPTPTPTPEPVEPILLVDDDTGDSYESYFTAALNALSKGHNVWDVQSQGSPSAAKLQQHQVVIWFTGNDYTTTLTSTDQTNLTAYLNGGGKLFITGQDIGYDIYTSSFYGSYLHASYVLDDTNTYGLTGYDVLSGLDVNISGGDGANNQSYPSEISLGSGAVGLYDYDGSYTWGGLRWEGAYKVVYFSFGYEAISTAASRNSVMSAVLTWLEGGAPPPTPTPTTPPPPTDTPTPTPTPTDTPTPTHTPTPTPTPTHTPTPTPSSPDTMYVADIQMSYQQLNKNRFQVFADVTVKDLGLNPVDGATVSVRWTTPDSKTTDQQQVTGATGVASFDIIAKPGLYQICVTDVIKAGWTYDPNQNVETCDTITVP